MHVNPVHLHITINAPAPVIFATLIDLPAYGTWLSESGVFKGTTEVSDTPVRQGSTYVEKGPAGVRYGTILELEEPSRIVFSQPMRLNASFLGLVIDIKVTMTITEGTEGTLLERTVQLALPWVLVPFQSGVTGMFRKESWRTMEKLKGWLEMGAGREEVVSEPEERVPGR